MIGKDRHGYTRKCKLCKAVAFSYDDRPPSWQFIVVKMGRCNKCSPHIFLENKKVSLKLGK